MEVSVNGLSKRIYTLRGIQVMLDEDLAESYGVETKSLKRAVRRNMKRFPKDFMFELTREELENSLNCGTNVRCQIGTLRQDAKLLPYLPFAFTENGVGMLSSVLHSEKAIQVNIEIVRAFVEFRKSSLISRLETQPKIQRPQDPVRLIQKIVARHWSLKVEDLQSSARKKSTTLARHIAIYLIRNQLNMSFPEIGWHFGKRDHTSIMHAYHKIGAASGLQETLGFLQNEIRRQLSGYSACSPMKPSRVMLSAV